MNKSPKTISNKSWRVSSTSTWMESSTETWNRPTYSWKMENVRSVTLDSLKIWKMITLSWNRLSVPHCTCRRNSLRRPNTPTNLICGQSVLFTMKCFTGEPHGQPQTSFSCSMEFTQKSHPFTLQSVQFQRILSWSVLKSRKAKEWAGKMHSIIHCWMNTESSKDRQVHVTHQNQASARKFSIWNWSRKLRKLNKDG